MGNKLLQMSDRAQHCPLLAVRDLHHWQLLTVGQGLTAGGESRYFTV